MRKNYEPLFSRSDPAQSSGVIVDKMPDSMNWISLVDKLANKDITKHDAIWKMPYQYCLMQLLLHHNQDKYIEQVNRANARKNKIRR